MIPDLAEPSGWHLSLAEREEIAEGWAAGLSKSEIARGLGRYRCTIGTDHPRRRAQAQPGPAQPETGTAAGRAAVAPRARTGHQPRPEPAPARAAALPRVGGPRQGRAAGPAVETDQTGEQSGAAHRGRDPAPQALEPGTDQPDTGTRLPRSPGDAGVPRDDLPGPLRAGPGPAAPGTIALPAHRTCGAPPTPAARSTQEAHHDPRHTADLSPAGRGRGPRRARTLGGRPDHRQRQRISHRDPGRTQQPVRDAAAPARPARRRAGPRRHDHHHAHPAGGDPPLPDPGSRKGTDPARPRSPSPWTCRSTSATRTALGSAAATRTPTGCYASTSPRAPTCPGTPGPTSTSSPPNSTHDHARHTAGTAPPRSFLGYCLDP